MDTAQGAEFPKISPIVTLTPEEIAAIPEQQMPELGEGVSHRVIWHGGASLAGVMRIAPGGHLDEHVHRWAHHHFWILTGRCEVLGKTISAGGYVHIPGGVDHGVVALGPEGCSFYYLYVRA